MPSASTSISATLRARPGELARAPRGTQLSAPAGYDVRAGQSRRPSTASNPYFGSTPPEAYFRPDRRTEQPSRAAAVQGWRAAPPEGLVLDGREHDGSIGRLGDGRAAQTASLSPTLQVAALIQFVYGVYSPKTNPFLDQAPDFSVDSADLRRTDQVKCWRATTLQSTAQTIPSQSCSGKRGKIHLPQA